MAYSNLSLLLIITIVDIIHHPIFHLKHDVSDTGFYLSLQVEPTKLVQIERALYFRTGIPTQYIPPESEERI
jgi:hypothetical protein